MRNPIPVTALVLLSACTPGREGACPDGWYRDAAGLCRVDDGDAPPGDDDDAGPALLFPDDGEWSGGGIEFEVSAGGTWIEVSFADYGSCSNGGCSASAHSTCGSCGASIDNDEGEASFDQDSMGCHGTFTSATTASGTCSDWSDCGCTMSRSWSASLD